MRSAVIVGPASTTFTHIVGPKTNVLSSFDSSSSDDTALVFATAVADACASVPLQIPPKTRRSGSRIGRHFNIPDLRYKVADNINRHEFYRMVIHGSMRPVFCEEDFKRVYLMPHEVKQNKRQGCLDDDIFFAEDFDAAGRPSAMTDQKPATALHQHAYEPSAHSITNTSA